MKGLFYRAYSVNKYAFLLPIVLYSMYLLTMQLMHVKRVRATVSGSSVCFIAEVQNYVQSICFYPAHSILKKVIKQFPFITDVSIIRAVDQTMYCDGTIKNIAYVVNNEHIITDDGMIVAAVYFDSFLIEHAKKCVVKDDFFATNVDKILFFLNQIPEAIFSAYHLSIHNDYDVRLYPLSTTEYYIKLTLDILFDQQIVHEAIIQIPYIKKQYPAIYKNNQCIVIDMRFKDQIVFTKEDKGIL